MTVDEVEVMRRTIISDIETVGDWKEVYQNFSGLLAYQDVNTKEIAEAAFQNNIFYPPTLYRDASQEIESALIEQLLMPDCKNANDLLSCLAVSGGDKVREVFYKLEKDPLPWRKNLYAGPSIYAEQAGWALDENGDRIELNYRACYSIEADEGEDNAVKVGEVKADSCSICNCQIVNILTVDGTDERLSFLGLSGKIVIPVCPNCASMCEKTIIRYCVDGESTFEIVDPYTDENYLSEADVEKMINNKLTLSKTSKPTYFACGNDELSTIGGTPQWVQDWQYENCPDCQKKMKLLSALSWDQILGSAEGTLYLEICIDCAVVVAFHQQT